MHSVEYSAIIKLFTKINLDNNKIYREKFISKIKIIV